MRNAAAAIAAQPAIRAQPPHGALTFRAGHPAAVFSTSFDELVSLTGATEIDVA